MTNYYKGEPGRTSRMMEEARDLEEMGKAVYVIAADSRHARRLKKMAEEKWGSTSIQFESPSLRNFDWETTRLLGANPNCVVLIDHYAIEARFAAILEMLHRYDVEEAIPDTRPPLR